MAKNSEIFPKAVTDRVVSFDNAIISADESTKSLDETFDNLIKRLEKSKISFSDVQKVQKKAVDETKKLSDEEKKLDQIEKTLKNNTDDVVKARIKASQQAKEQKDRISDLIQAEERELGTEEKLLLANKKLREDRKKLITTTKEGKEEQDAINNSINENNDLLKENSDKFKQNRMSVGGYQEGIEAALGSTEQFKGGLGGVLSGLTAITQEEGGVKKLFTTFVGGIKSATKAGLKFILTPIGAVIFAIVAAIALFTAAIGRNERESDKFGKIWDGITNIISEVVGAIFKLASALGKLITLDFSGAFEDASDAMDGFKFAVTGAFKEGVKLVQMQIDLEEATIKTTTAQAKLNKEIEKLEIISGDSTKSFAVREAAAEKARKSQIALAEETISIAKQELDIIDLKVKQAKRQDTDSRELRQEQADAAAKLIEAEGSLTVALANNEKERLELKQDRLEKDLDILIDGFDNVKAINERIIASDSMTIEKRQALLDKTVQLGEASFAKQIETLKQFTNVNLDENDLLAEQDAILLNEKIRNLGLSEIIEGRLLEVIREKRTAAQDLVEAQKSLDDEVIANKLENARKQKEIDDKLIADEIENAKKLQEEFTAQSEKRIADLEILAQVELIILKTRFAEGEITREEFATKAVMIEFEKNQKIANGELDVLEQQIANAELSDEVRRGLADQASALRRQLAEDEADHLITIAEETADKKKEIDDEEEERNEERTKRRIELAGELGNALFAFRSIAIDKEQTKLQEARETELARAGEDKEKQEEINKKFDKKESELKRKKAVNEKIAALFQIAISTAVAIATASPLVPLMIFAAATGLLQAGIVLARPIPKFSKGTKFVPTAGKIEVAEKGRELARKSTGELMLFNKPTITDDMYGATIYKSEDTEQILRGLNKPDNRGEFAEMIESNKMVAEALAKQPIYHFETSKFQIHHRKGDYFETYINRKIIGL